MRSIKLALFLVSISFFSFSAFSQEYQFELFKAYDSNGNQVKISDKVENIKSSDVVFFGELHNQAVSHWLSLQILKLLPEDGLAAGFEMFETDQQIFLNELSRGIIKAEKLKDVTHIWPNYETDYAPLVNYCIENDIQLLATNVPRRYASITAKVGLDSLSKLEIPSIYLPQSNFDLPQDYVTYDQIKNMGGHGMNMEFFVQAQAIKDYTMATIISNALNSGVKKVFHLNGSFHSTKFEGIVGFLTNINPDISVFTVEVVIQDNLAELNEENKGKADLIIVLPSDSPVTY
ncbi:ChaN family lipoprotein [Mangrovivirga sp. M17]|uniref:ChaN family lipoprotein n=1 Tax=Mangrovivirga halotolerans TaxID=2993936 RepID=A0ABT3RUG7_9BACT|nr:ChaN family lipoprotein [Mangrovivirga halotolerans]MCX2744988.1 ChaN family lipoprotein [Mangrovivirga halotolerans]